jgi:hypothetical protein
LASLSHVCNLRDRKDIHFPEERMRGDPVEESWEAQLQTWDSRGN